mmetsp:Transcript_40580/g.73342  ORF Transcript_40580/g.73342 Transcript_40580/m.73342 type:complete len:115 (-) Transcript_40580:90-434(-)
MLRSGRVCGDRSFRRSSSKSAISISKRRPKHADVGMAIKPIQPEPQVTTTASARTVVTREVHSVLELTTDQGHEGSEDAKYKASEVLFVDAEPECRCNDAIVCNLLGMQKSLSR